MRDFTEFRSDQRRKTARARLFALQAQTHAQRRMSLQEEAYRLPSLEFARLMRAPAVASMRPYSD